MRLIVSGGGTGGHIYPALAIAREVKDRIPAAQILYVGTQQGLESKIVPDSGWQFQTIDISGIDRSSMLKAGRSLIKFPNSFFQARDIIKTFKPDVIVGTGGYVSFPIVLAGTFFGVKTFIHEQNAVPGLANRHLARRADGVMLTFAEAGQYLQARSVKLTGLPVRKEIIAAKPQRLAIKNQDREETFFILAFGGSQGARSINRAMLEVVERYRQENVNITWITGHNNYHDIAEHINRSIAADSLDCKLQLLPYLNNIETAMTTADVAVCRAGASTLCELEVLGLPAILVPYPYAAENHQEKNARALVAKKAARMVIDEFLDGDTLYKMLEDLRKNRSILKSMGENMFKEAKPNALNDIVDLILG